MHHSLNVPISCSALLAQAAPGMRQVLERLVATVAAFAAPNE